ncbi:hypothetical protein ASD21_16460 [Caulobacter sp. Root1455]|nr:hypothetical protein ASD21_16460 [Caulobacter sp. Root1455]
MALGKVIAAALLAFPATAIARAALCGSATATSANTEVFVTAQQRSSGPAVVTDIATEAFSADRTVSMGVYYDPAETGLGPPNIPKITWHMALPDPTAAEPERLTWRIGEGPWTGPRFTSKPERRWGDPARNEGYLSGIVPPAGIAPLQAAIAESTPVTVRRLSADGRVLAEGNVQYPPASKVQALYAKARASALANLKPCRPGLSIPPAKR